MVMQSSLRCRIQSNMCVIPDASFSGGFDFMDSNCGDCLVQLLLSVWPDEIR